MAAIVVPKPGSPYLCARPCGHGDSLQHRFDAQARCWFCKKRIGYERAWITISGGQAAHFDCADEKAQQGGTPT